jgi:hypothetical protein
MTAPSARRRPGAAARLVRGAVLALAAPLVACAVLAAADPRPGTIQLSDGTSWDGEIALIPGGALLLHDGTNAKTIDVGRVRTMRLRVAKEHLERNFRMPEAGKAFREETGEPYPVRELSTQIELLDGSTISGHLGTTALTIDVAAPGAKPDDPPERHKVILPAKLQGKPGEGFATLVFPALIRFSDQPAAAAAATRLQLLGGDAEELAVLTRDGLAALAAQRTGPGAFTIEPAFGAGMFLAARSGNRVRVGWPAGGDAALRERLALALKDASDFFDERQILGAWRVEGASEAFTVVRLVRRGAVVDSPAKPWGVEIWRWHLEDDGGKVMLAGRGKLFRGEYRDEQGEPAVTLSTSLWNPVEKSGTLQVEEAGR